MRIAWLIALLLGGLPAKACDIYASEVWGHERTAEFDYQNLILTDHGTTVRYGVMTGGTGVPYWVAYDIENPEAAGHWVREYDGVLIIDMEIFYPDCVSALGVERLRLGDVITTGLTAGHRG